tara:strand:- start:4135 stop:4650 length:516 start_codon:yes stop_codon:yes gene_type:complete
MRPIPSQASREAIELLNKAQRLEERMNKAQNFKEDSFTAREAVQEKKMKEQAEPVQKSGDMGSQPTFNVSFNTNPQGIGFVSETAGQTRSAYYTTNQHLLDSEDVANKGATSSSVNLETLGGQMNPHEGSGVDRLDENGVISKAVCSLCYGNQYTGHKKECPHSSPTPNER